MIRKKRTKSLKTLQKKLESFNPSTDGFFTLKNITIGTGVLAAALTVLSGLACKDDLTAQCVQGLPERLVTLFQ